ncbi:FAD-dependent monooxygenase [Paenibacillus urinalis]|uniref:FAD-dependent oxidoreductase n=1 Tax=Paenibacillus urinalis TaxID=521520 RepID=UPI002368962A|nr:FAD-dependent monooxygenase [Paenibacillus urinalis]WDH95761.1 FAD-dependent monooxygenase [Paenibacillus urinalis]
MNPQVLIVGAGPTGLVMALALQKQGIPFRIVDKNSGTGEASRAIVVHARTLEYYQQLGLAEELAQRGIPIQELQIRKDGELKASMKMGDIGLGISPYPYVLSLPQDEHEAILESALEGARRPCGVEYGTNIFQRRGRCGPCGS